MLASRRNLLRGLGLSVAAASATHFVRDLSLASPLPAQVLESNSASIRLDRNENPYGPSEQVKEAMRRGLAQVNRFPESELDALTGCIASLHSIRAEQVILGCGSTEILRACTNMFLRPGKKLLMAAPGFQPIAQYARAVGADLHTLPLNKLHEPDVSAMAQGANSGVGLIYLSNPHNPTGTLIPLKELEAFVAALPAHVHLIIDEAYHEYVKPSPSYQSFAEVAARDGRVTVTRTFSKIHGLAGLRIGYAITASETARRLSALGLPNGVNVAAAQAACISLQDETHLRTSAQRNADERQEFFNQANARMLLWIDSHTNFVMLNTSRSADQVAQHFRKHSIRVMSGIPAMQQYIRVSLGTSKQMKEFWRVWDLLPGASGHTHA